MSVQQVMEATTQYLSFFIGEEEYGLGILEAREIIQYPTVTKVPAMPPAIRGVINLRGSVLPLVDLAVLFGYAARPVSKWTCVVVVERTQEERRRDLVGIVVDSISQVLELGAAQIEPPPSFGTRAQRHFLRGMGQSGKGFVLLLDLQRLLSDPALEGEAAALDAGGPTTPGSAANAPAGQEPAA